MVGIAHRAKESWTPTGYLHSDAKYVVSAASYKIVKAHNFLGKRGGSHGQKDGRVLVFDEAQRTYEKGRMVLGAKLPDHEADLILNTQKAAYPTGGAVVVALIGHNQAINRGERGMVAWLEAAKRCGWTYSIADETLVQGLVDPIGEWGGNPNRAVLHSGHLAQSMRFFRNAAMEEWAGAVLDRRAADACSIASRLSEHGEFIWLTRELSEARSWARKRAVGDKRSGLIASGQARRLAAEGLFVDYKPDIKAWMLAPTSDIRSSNALETVQNQYQIQGLELDYSIVCWDADLRRENGAWISYKINGSAWQRDKAIDIAKNSYRVLLTRARRGLTVFVPKGDSTGLDATRDEAFYDGVYATGRWSEGHASYPGSSALLPERKCPPG
jgi:Schlafen group 3, DNA/RNA helicase domain